MGAQVQKKVRVVSKDQHAMNRGLLSDPLMRTCKSHMKALENAKKRALTQWEELERDAEDTPNMGKPKLAQLIGKNIKRLLGITKWGYGHIDIRLLNKLENSEILSDLIFRSKMDYAQPLKFAWSEETWKSKKSLRREFIDHMKQYHACQRVHAGYHSMFSILNNKLCPFFIFYLFSNF